MKTSAARGTTPQGIKDEAQAAEWVRGMFGQIAGRYDLLNHLLSFNLDKRWRARLVKRIEPVLARREARVLDLCCGTGDVAIALEERRKGAVLAADFCHPMLVEANRKFAARRLASHLFEADGLNLPVADGSLDLITISFGFRNFANYEAALVELLRVLKPGGMLAILEFSQPENRAFFALYNWFSTTLLPKVGAWISGSRDAYAYLPESIRKFPDAPGLEERIRMAGYTNVEYELMTFGAVALHLAVK